MAAVKQLYTVADLEATWKQAEEGPLLIFKHSTIWPTSANAHREWESFLQTNPRVPLAFVRVIEERPLSQEIARRTGVKHESPQAILINRGKVVWHADHQAITAGALRDALAQGLG